MNWQDSPRHKAAALAGIASNQAFPPKDRLDCALQALDLLFEHLEQLDSDGREAKGREEIQ